MWFMWMKTVCISTQNLLLSQGDKVVINLMCIQFVKQGNNFRRKKELHVEIT